MLMQHIGFRVRGFYKIASLSNQQEAMMSTNAQQELDALGFWNKHGLNATSDAYKVSRSTLYRWRKSHCEGGISGLHDRSRAPRQRRRRSWPPALRVEIRRLRTVFPNLGKDKLHVLLQPWSAHRGWCVPVRVRSGA